MFITFGSLRQNLIIRTCQAATIQFLDLSQNSLDKKSVEYICASLKPYSAEAANENNGKDALDQGLASLRMDDCQLRPNSLETLCEPAFRSIQSNLLF